MELGSQIHFRLLGIDEDDDDPIAGSLGFQVTIQRDQRKPWALLHAGQRQ